MRVTDKRIAKTFLELVEIDGKSGNESRVADYIQKYLSKIGIKSERDSAGETFGGNSGNVIANIESSDKEIKDTILLSCHMDTIEPTKGIKTILSNGVIKTDGTTILGADNRAGVAAILEAVTTIIQNKIEHPNLKIVFSVAEEIGMFGSKNIDVKSLNEVCGFVFDSSADPGKVILKAPASYKIKIIIYGKAAHAAVKPEKGISAVKIAGNAIAKVEIGKFDDDTLFNIGTIKGGKAVNIVPDLVEIEAECRGFDNEKTQNRINLIKKTFEDEAVLLGGKIDFQVNQKYGLLDVSENSLPVIICHKAIKEAGLEPVNIRYSGGSDANVYNSKGLPTVNIGMGFQNVHSPQENIKLANLIKDVEIAINIIKNSYKILKTNSE